MNTKKFKIFDWGKEYIVDKKCLGRVEHINSYRKFIWGGRAYIWIPLVIVSAILSGIVCHFVYQDFEKLKEVTVWILGLAYGILSLWYYVLLRCAINCAKGRRRYFYIKILLPAIIATILFLVLANMGENISENIYKQGDTVNFSEATSLKFDKVCIFGPYSSNADVSEILGFDWDIESRTNISSSDSVNIIVFTKNKKVIEYTAHPRNKNDFYKLSRNCFPYEFSKIRRDPDQHTWHEER